MKKQEYGIRVERRDDDHSEYIAYSEELGAMACCGLGATPEEAIADYVANEATYLEQVLALGMQLPVAKHKNLAVETRMPSGTFTVRTSPEIHAAIIKKATEQSVSLNLFVNQVLSSANAWQDARQWMDGRADALEAQLERHHSDMAARVTFRAPPAQAWKGKLDNMTQSDQEYGTAA